jgi:preprotein translocase subunit SecF
MIRALNFITKDTNIDFMGKKKIAFTFSTLLVLASLFFVATKGLNYGIDFSGGILIEVQTDEVADLKAMRSTLNELKIGEIGLQSIGKSGKEIMIRAQAAGDDEKEQMKSLNKIKEALGSDGIEYRRVELVGPKVGSELIDDGIYAVIFSILAICAYIWFRFEWQFALGAMIALTHDVISIVGVFALMQMDFSLTTIAAILTIAGYSINDTVVSFDRVRENLRKYKKKPIEELLNQSINEMFSRTLLTSITTLLAVIAIFVLGGDALKGFSFAMIWGVVIGTFSSMYIAMPFLTLFNLRKSSAPVNNPYESVE